MKILGKIFAALMYVSVIASFFVISYPKFTGSDNRELIMNCIIASAAMLFFPIVFFISRALFRDKFSIADELSKRSKVDITIKIK